MKAGVALNPHTPVAVLQDVLQEIDLVCLMSVNPGFGGQIFIESTYAKIQQLQHMIALQDTKTIIEIDGGVNLENTAQLWKAGAQVLVAGHSVFSAPDPSDMIDQLLQL
jgi:ribulose-phosphate 3-epimerase